MNSVLGGAHRDARGLGQPAIWSLVVIAASVFLLASLTAFRIRGGVAVDPGILATPVVALYEFFGFEPAFMCWLLILAWSSIWFLTGTIEEPARRVLQILTLAFCLSILVNLRSDGIPPEQGGVLGGFFATRLYSVFGFIVSTLAVSTATIVLLFRATDSFFIRYFEGSVPFVRASEGDDGVETQAIDELQSLKLTSKRPVEPIVAAGVRILEPRTQEPSERRQTEEDVVAETFAAIGEALAIDDEAQALAADEDGTVDADRGFEPPTVESSELELELEFEAEAEAEAEFEDDDEPDADDAVDTADLDLQIATLLRADEDDVAADDADEDTVDDEATADGATSTVELAAPAEFGREPEDEEAEEAEAFSTDALVIIEHDAEFADEPDPPAEVEVATDESASFETPSVFEFRSAAPGVDDVADEPVIRASIEPVEESVETTDFPDEPVVELPSMPPVDRSKQGALFGSAAADNELVREAARLVLSHRRANTNFLRRRLRVSTDEAVEVLGALDRLGVVECEDGASQARVLIDLETWEARVDGA